MARRLSLLFAILMGVVIHSANLTAQTAEPAVRWLDFPALELALAEEARPVLVDFYADWCAACLRMDKRAYRDPRVVRLLNERYYAVRMNVESPDTIVFGGRMYVNERLGRVNPVHQIPLLLAGRQDKPFSLPAIVLFDDEFTATDRYFQYLSTDQLLKILSP
ncbi:thioredoxin family protein [Lewinella sp. JB7]|uniref:thioredoxin family protein n=1 Tax=Lewinella sp. JB7 TaxID=2962887 RepID=UPI0020C961EA|nr:thioredoxin family protein [Lewinella sp. JB7]MCP9234926.1 thioredoxin family protein [Lewinella sp. JB7]